MLLGQGSGKGRKGWPGAPDAFLGVKMGAWDGILGGLKPETETKSQPMARLALDMGS